MQYCSTMAPALEAVGSTVWFGNRRTTAPRARTVQPSPTNPPCQRAALHRLVDVGGPADQPSHTHSVYADVHRRHPRLAEPVHWVWCRLGRIPPYAPAEPRMLVATSCHDDGRAVPPRGTSRSPSGGRECLTQNQRRPARPDGPSLVPLPLPQSPATSLPPHTPAGKAPDRAARLHWPGSGWSSSHPPTPRGWPSGAGHAPAALPGGRQKTHRRLPTNQPLRMRPRAS